MNCSIAHNSAVGTGNGPQNSIIISIGAKWRERRTVADVFFVVYGLDFMYA